MTTTLPEAKLAAPCALARDSDVIGGLEHALSIGPGFGLAAANLSLGSGAYTNQSDCDSDNSDFKDAIDNLRSIGIATVVASGNGGMSDKHVFQPGVAVPACISSAISVGAIAPVFIAPETVAPFSQTASFLNLLAPGSSIQSSVPGKHFDFDTGTSMAAPHVTGAWAALRGIAGGQSVTAILNALTSTGTPVLDTRGALPLSTPRTDLVAAAEQLTRAPLAPSNLHVTTVTGTTATLGWNDNSQSETSFLVEYTRTGSGNSWMIGVSPGVNQTSGDDRRPYAECVI